MRSVRKIPGNPWPHDMTITVADRPAQLLELLWLREAYGLHPEGADLPPLLVQTPESAATAVGDQTRAAWESAWPRIWRDVVAHAGSEVDRRLFEHIRETADGSPERASALREIVGPSWGDEFGRDALQDPSHDDWQRQIRDAFDASRRDLLVNSPERRDLDALIPAWRAGLTKIVTIPCRGVCAQKVGSNALLVTDLTRADSASYQRALRSFT